LTFSSHGPVELTVEVGGFFQVCGVDYHGGAMVPPCSPAARRSASWPRVAVRLLSRELARRATGATLYILDEPTTGRHFDDTKKLLAVLHTLVERGTPWS
jgi:hypothetical protein